MDQYQLESDPCDRRLIRLSNFLQLLSCVCDILANVNKSFKHIAQLVRDVATCVFYSTVACQMTQVNTEVEYQKAQGNNNPSYEPPMATATPIHDRGHGKAGMKR